MKNDEKLLLKQKSAQKALSYVKNGMVLGIGSGSTVREFIRLLAASSSLDLQSIICIPSSFDTESLLVKANLRLGRLNQFSKIDLTIDGADRVDSKLNLIKGGGGALLREKIVAAASKEVIIIVDESKLVKELAGSYPIPVEVLPLAKVFVENALQKLGGKPSLRLAANKLGATITDNGNMLLDTEFTKIPDIAKLEEEINNIPGVFENGLFSNRLVTRIIIATTTKGIIVKEK
ncbi:ribose 5-phosphate isomerase A [Candidatus Heimdallarchaeota archaeon]|nr:MAG: ribose 5-phosphate isomerase A [Candidatus Gerdarchaeota archaeon]RLI72670.1 MAG: ribose 5-phosphate isomerase A [Candidatus Heimdallarchaeota archaeon]